MMHSLQLWAIDLFRLVLWLVVLMVVFIPAERLWSLRRQSVLRKAFGTDLAYYFLSGFLPKFLVVLPLTLLAGVLHGEEPGSFYEWIADLPLLVRLAAAMIVGELGAYWGHRLSHEIPWLWRFHAIHHSAEEMDWLVNSRAHPLDLAVTRLSGLIPMYVLGLAQPIGNGIDIVPLLVTIIGTLWGYFIHANIAWRFGPLEWVLSSPAFHHWHHTNDGPELINRNYASMLPWLDRLFGTHYLPKTWPSKYGIDEPMPPSLGGQLVQPLRSTAGSNSSAPQSSALAS